METTEDIIRLFELVKDAPDKYWEHNRKRLLEILNEHDEVVRNKALSTMKSRGDSF